MSIFIKERIEPRFWLEVDLRAIEANISNIKQLLGTNSAIIAVVKADAYGHGLLKVAETISSQVDLFAVSGLDEAVILREAGIANPILFLSNPVREEDLEIIYHYRIIPTINDITQILWLNSYAQRHNFKLVAHLKIDSGMGRLGIRSESYRDIGEKLLASRNLILDAIYTHFAKAEDPQYTREQIARFEQAVSYLKQITDYNFRLHAANSCATLKFSSIWYHWVRVGLIIYGIYPEPAVKNRISLTQAICLKTRLIAIKEIPAGSYIGYGCSYKTSSCTKIGIIPVGYAHGIPWTLSNKGAVLIRGKRVPIIGRISMDQIIINLKEIENPALGEEIVVVGRQEDEEIRVEEIAELAGTIPYEILCGIGNVRDKRYLFKEVNDEE